MTGKYTIEVGNRRVKYKLEIKRNITIICGNSATGKTTLVNLIEQYNELGKDSGVTLHCDRECVVLRGKNWFKLLDDINNSIVFIDEGSKFVESEEFARAIQNSTNYYVIITRKSLKQLPYSIEEIYGLQVDKEKSKENVAFNALYRIYFSNGHIRKIKPSVVITEDSHAGFAFFREVCNFGGIECKTSNGNSNIERCIQLDANNGILIVDGAAFGPYIESVINKLNITKGDWRLLCPESFEWMILQSGIFGGKVLKDIIEHPYNYIESRNYFSWERYFTYLLSLVTASEMNMRKYDKTSNSIDRAFLNKENILKILSLYTKVIDFGIE